MIIKSMQPQGSKDILVSSSKGHAGRVGFRLLGGVVIQKQPSGGHSRSQIWVIRSIDYTDSRQYP